MGKNLGKIFCAFLCVLLLNGCGTNLMEFYFGDLFESGSEIGATPDQLIWQGLQSMQDKDYKDAQKAFEKIIQEYPYSKYVVLAELKLADAYYLDKKYNEAAEAYEQFARLHPSNPVVPYALYQLGMSYANMARSIDRDHEQLNKALTVFERITQAYPGTIWAQKAREKGFECRKKLAEYEIYVARFYIKRGEYRAAAGRLEYVLSEYLSEVNEMGKVKEIQKMLGECQKKVEEGFDRPSLWTRLGF